MRDTVRLHEVQNYEGLRAQVEENLLEMQQEAEVKQAHIRTAFMRAHPELEGLEWHMPLIPEPQSRCAWKKEQCIARAYTPEYTPFRPTQPKLMHISANSAKPYIPS